MAHSLTRGRDAALDRTTGDGAIRATRRSRNGARQAPLAVSNIRSVPCGHGGLRRAALPHQLLVPRRGQPPRGAGRRRRRASGWPAWRSPTTTASTAWSASRSRRADARAPDRLRRGADARDHPARERRARSRGRAPRRARRGPGRVRAPRPRDQRGADGGGEGRAAHHDRRARRRARAPVHLHPHASARNDSWFVLTGCRKGTVPAALVRDGPAAARARARPARRRVRARPRARGAVGPRRPARPSPQRRARAGRDRPPASRWSPPTTCTTPRPRSARSPPRSRRCGRAARSTRSTAGSPRRRSRTSAARREQARRFARWPGAVERTVDIAQACAFDLRLAAPELPDHDVPAGHTEMTWLRELTARGARRPLPVDALAPRAGDAPDRARARRDRAAQLPRLLPRAGRHRRVLPRARHLLPGPGERGEQRGLLRARRHQGRRGRARPAVRAVPLARARRPTRHRPRHRAPAARGGDPVRLRQVRPRPRRAGRERHHLPAALGAARDGEGDGPLTRSRRRAHQVDRPVGSRRRARSTRSRPTRARRRCRRSRSISPSRCSTSRATSASTRAGW